MFVHIYFFFTQLKEDVSWRIEVKIAFINYYAR